MIRAFWTKFDIRQYVRQVLLLLLGWLVLNVGFLLLMVQPRVREYRALEEGSRPRLEMLAERKTAVDDREGFASALRQAEDDLRELRTEWLGTRARRMVPVQLELDRLWEQFGINPDQVQIQNSEMEDEGLERMAMVVPLEGGYGELRRFIQAVETSERFLVIERIALGQAQRQPAEGRLQLNITLATYFDAPYLKRRDDEARRRRDRGAAPGRV